jgi:hypothetical protein
MDRTLTITQTGPHTFTAAVRDAGSFTTIRSAFTPNQGGSDAGKHIRGRVSGQVNGAASYSFTATTEPDAHLVPSRENGDPATGPQSTSDWFEQAFPAGTTFGGTGIGNWNWAYAAKVTVTKYRTVTVYRHGHKVHVTVPYRATQTQRWDDGISDNGGQTAAAGNITGRHPRLPLPGPSTSLRAGERVRISRGTAAREGGRSPGRVTGGRSRGPALAGAAAGGRTAAAT